MNLKGGGEGNRNFWEKQGVEMMLIQYLHENFKIYLVSIFVHPSIKKMSSSGWLWRTGCHHSRVPPSRQLGGTVGVAVWNVNRVTHSKLSGGGKRSKPMTSKVPIVFSLNSFRVQSIL